jgi:hypothetical protein
MVAGNFSLYVEASINYSTRMEQRIYLSQDGTEKLLMMANNLSLCL